MKVIPISRALSRIWCDSSSVAFGPKCMLPRQILLTDMFERPSLVYSMNLLSSRLCGALDSFVVDALSAGVYPSCRVIKRLHTAPHLP